MYTKLFLAALLLVPFLGCQASPTRSEPTVRPDVSSGDGRTVVARPETTAPPQITVVIEQDPGETSAAPPGTIEAIEAQNTEVSAPAGTTTEPPVAEDTPAPTTEIVRPLLPTPAPTGAATGSNTTKQGAVGTPLDLGSALITVKGIESSPGREGDVPRPGNQYLIVALTLQNKSNVALTFDASQFALRKNDGTIIAYDDVTFQDSLLRSTNLEPGAQQDVFLVFQIAEGSTGYTLVLGEAGTTEIANIRLN